MIVRNLWFGALMLGLGAVFTWGLAVAMQQHATADISSYKPSAPSVASGKRADQHWMF
jgi:hypothetical protein